MISDINELQSLIDKLLVIFTSNCNDTVRKKLNFDNINAKEFELFLNWYESYMWANGLSKDQQNNYRLMHKVYQERFACNQRTIIIIIPVADRPKLLKQCMQSIHQQCEWYGYGGTVDKKYYKIKVIIADDSENTVNIESNCQLRDSYTSLGLNVEYFGLAEQKRLLDHLDKSVGYLIGNEEQALKPHKGASITRNLVYLKLKQANLDNQETLIYFIDSDQEFKVVYNASNNQKEYFIPNYFYHLNRLFDNQKTKIITGKVVGDPPVSPAVMTGKMLDDIAVFLEACLETGDNGKCAFHNHDKCNADDAAYHDMPDMFGFANKNSTYSYACNLTSVHTVNDVFIEFSSKLNGFFHGAHPTRNSWYEYQSVDESQSLARTVYTGNYIIRPEMLGYFIPFASLKLRMAGPVLGRLIKSVFTDAFCSVNLPMLHTRTFSVDDLSEYRAGVDDKQSMINLTDESVRQYFGDIMLFTVERLVQKGYPLKKLDAQYISTVLQEIDNDLFARYQSRHLSIIDMANQVKSVVNDQTAWWNHDSTMVSAVDNFNRFLDNVYYNFADESYLVSNLSSKEIRESMLDKMCSALTCYPLNLKNWSAISL